MMKRLWYISNVILLLITNDLIYIHNIAVRINNNNSQYNNGRIVSNHVRPYCLSLVAYLIYVCNSVNNNYCQEVNRIMLIFAFDLSMNCGV